MTKTKTVYHPVFRGVSYEVPEPEAVEWKAKGYRFTPIADRKREKQPEPTVEVHETEG